MLSAFDAFFAGIHVDFYANSGVKILVDLLSHLSALIFLVLAAKVPTVAPI